jgi:hypothetical protein
VKIEMMSRALMITNGKVNSIITSRHCLAPGHRLSMARYVRHRVRLAYWLIFDATIQWKKLRGRVVGSDGTGAAVRN